MNLTTQNFFTLKILCYYLLILTSIYFANARPKESSNIDIASCKCVHFNTCTWGKQIFETLQQNFIQQLYNVFRLNICDDPKKEHVWCCENGSYPDNLEQLKELNEYLQSKKEKCQDSVSIK